MFDTLSMRISAAGLSALLGFTAVAATPSSTDNAKLYGTRWLVQAVDGVPLARQHRTSPMQLVLHADSQHLSGFAGCNSIAGRFIQRGTQLALSARVRTRLSCPAEVMAQERKLLAGLGTVDAYRIEGPTLSLLQGEVVRVAFKAAPQ